MKSRGRADVIEMHHRKPRFAMFTPMKVAKGPKNASAVGDLRVTIGELANGQSCCIDEWKAMAEPHERLSQPWTGNTYFASALNVPTVFSQRPRDR